ncbi:DDE-type integrase/transposase/recombinase [Nitrolancea hollandica]|uniref:DDE-type integrase/transposase/recombinase n=1 Tax=Nitrolancea hollandica TaxID=1206749 RepID=UPI00135F1765|nr:DDE-type integrase/transposase/recombinase [Nitrolancea hollandica]
MNVDQGAAETGGRIAGPPAPNRLARDFHTQAPDQVWLGDSTYVSTWEGWLYLAILLDAYSRRVVGCSMADHLRTELALEALHMALTGRPPTPGSSITWAAAVSTRRMPTKPS